MKNRTRPILGLIVVLIGAGLLLQQLGLWAFGSIIGTFWPVLIIIAGLLSLRANPKQWMWPAFVILAGVLLQLNQLHIISFNFWQLFWPLLIILGGISLITGHVEPPVSTSAGDTVDLFAAFSGLDTRNKSPHFKGGKLTALFGGIKLDLREAGLADGAVLDTFVIFGGAEILVPTGWQVHTSGMPIVGGWNDKTRKPTGTAPVLQVHGTAIFGGVEIKHE